MGVLGYFIAVLLFGWLLLVVDEHIKNRLTAGIVTSAMGLLFIVALISAINR